MGVGMSLEHGWNLSWTLKDREKKWRIMLINVITNDYLIPAIFKGFI